LSNPPVEAILKVTFYHVNRPDYTNENPCIAKTAVKVAYEFGNGLIQHSHWHLDDKSEFVLKMKKMKKMRRLSKTQRVGAIMGRSIGRTVRIG
jgi:hypothetical protein